MPLYSEAVATSDTVSYLRSEQDLQGEKGAYNILYPAYGTHAGGNVAIFFPRIRLLISVVAVIPGHIAGRIRSATLDPEDQLPSGEEATPNPATINVNGADTQ